MTTYHYGFTRRKARILRQFLQEDVQALVPGTCLNPWDVVYAWGDTPFNPLTPIGAALVRVEDGFVRSVGLGVRFAEPISWTFDYQGLHHWGHRPTDLEGLIRNCADDTALNHRAAALRKRIVQEGVTKYNLPEQLLNLPLLGEHRKRVLVVGQVADDAALRGITTPIRTNLGLLAAVRERCPQAEIIYRPHPDVVTGLRAADDDLWRAFAHHRLTKGSLAQVLRHVHEVHVLNSLAGFEALLRHVPVVCYANPFYAGWGLTTDVHPLGRRSTATLDQLVAAALIKYPRYRHPVTGQRLEAEEALDVLNELRRARTRAPLNKCRELLLAPVARFADAVRLRRNAKVNGHHD